MARESMNQIKQQEGKIAEDTNDKKKWKDDHKGSSSQQQNKEPKVIKAQCLFGSRATRKAYAWENKTTCFVKQVHVPPHWLVCKKMWKLQTVGSSN
ncbi:hypothetical protein Tco_1502664 [Tanacetum coccineum]